MRDASCIVVSAPSRQPRTPRWALLHCHTIASDGQDTPSVLIQNATNLGMRHLVVTDHDTLAGYDQLRKQRHTLGCHLWPGVEMTVNDGGYRGHLTVLFPDGPALSCYQDIQHILTLPKQTRSIELLAALPVIVLSGCHGSILYRHGPYHWKSMLETLRRWKNLFGERLYLEVQPSFGAFAPDTYGFLAHVSNTRLVVTTDTHSTPSLPLWDEKAIRAFAKEDLWQAGVSRSSAIIHRLMGFENTGLTGIAQKAT